MVSFTRTIRALSDIPWIYVSYVTRWFTFIHISFLRALYFKDFVPDPDLPFNEIVDIELEKAGKCKYEICSPV